MGELYLVGIGPGNRENLTAAALQAMERADILCGYTLYIDLVKLLFPDKECHATPMTKEMDRCRYAVERAREGKIVAMLCSGDSGIYGMAGPVLQLLGEDPQVEVTVVPGVTAALSGAALLGAPLMNDFCVISLSDRLTPWPVIEKRLRSAAMGDFVICLYNPSSRGRRDHLKRACGILLMELSPETVCGWVRNIGRSGQEKRILTLGELQNEETDMFTTVFVGCGSTIRTGPYMVTPRGYRDE